MLGPGLTFAPFRMYQFFRLGSHVYQGRHLITELISDISSKERAQASVLEKGRLVRCRNEGSRE
ncbi:MAG: hypothetical protein MIO93_09815 [ANME-2 cluster archaeon]|nr:hypothetical protein [ANME-2 cluster archaeon]